MRTKQRMLALALITLLLSLAVAACGDNTATPVPATTAAATKAATTAGATTTAAATSAAATTAAATTAGAATTTAAAGKTVTIRIGTGDSGDGLAPYNQTIEAFKKVYPGIDIKVEPVTDSDYYGSLLTQVASGKAPDLIFIGDDEVADFVKKGAYEDLTPYINGTAVPGVKLDTSVFLPNTLQPGQQAGKQYLFPKDFSPVAVYYNKELLKAAGVAEPTENWTWDDFKAAAQKLTVKDSSGKVTQYGAQLTASWQRGFEAIAFTQGATLISADGSKYSGSLDSEASVKALTLVADLYRNGYAAPPSDINKWKGGNDNFANGTAALLIDGRWPQATLLKNPKLTNNIGVVGLPKGTQKANAINWGGFGIYSKSANKDAAWKVLSFFVSPDGGGQFFKDWGLTPLKPIADKNTNALDKVWTAQTEFFKPITANFTPYWNSAGAKELGDALTKVITDPKADPAATLKDAATKADKALKDKIDSNK
jgi:multiple sugar transport system substrate-binding protein